ncbi:MAG TPA: hypothetical protein VN624_09970 [Rhodanobacter sp.]|nr:hypothetical protein [Rhodanobacter sp.]
MSCITSIAAAGAALAAGAGFAALLAAGAGIARATLAGARNVLLVAGAGATGGVGGLLQPPSASSQIARHVMAAVDRRRRMLARSFFIAAPSAGWVE